MFTIYISIVVGFIFGYFKACLMMMAKQNSQADVDFENQYFNNKEDKNVV